MFLIINVTYSELQVCRRNKGGTDGNPGPPLPFSCQLCPLSPDTPPLPPSVIRVNRL